MCTVYNPRQILCMQSFYFFWLESIAVDAELQEKSLSELERLVDILHESIDNRVHEEDGLETGVV